MTEIFNEVTEILRFIALIEMIILFSLVIYFLTKFIITDYFYKGD